MPDPGKYKEGCFGSIPVAAGIPVSVQPGLYMNSPGCTKQIQFTLLQLPQVLFLRMKLQQVLLPELTLPVAISIL